jgi:hypothetical protein
MRARLDEHFPAGVRSATGIPSRGAARVPSHVRLDLPEKQLRQPEQAAQVCADRLESGRDVS